VKRNIVIIHKARTLHKTLSDYEYLFKNLYVL